MTNNFNSHTRLEPLLSTRRQQKLTPGTIYKPDTLIYDKNEQAIINDAIKIGYLIYPSKDVLWQIFQIQPNYNEFTEYLTHTKSGTNRSKNKSEYEDLTDLKVIRHLNLSNLHVLEIGDVCFCERIQILNLSNNYIIRIEPLIQCSNLIRLDLNNNQISQLPDMKFWGRMKNLKVLYLHNNPIAKLDSLRRLAASTSLEILTLFDTPLSLKKNYRHHVVNIVFTLKALDDYIVSDEEIIEDAKFIQKFSTKSPNLHCNLYIPISKSNDYYDEIRLTYELIKRVNLIIANHSPVHIIQKHIRSYLDRKYVKELKEARLWAAIKIQKWWRKQKNLSYKPSKLSTNNNNKSKNINEKAKISKYVQNPTLLQNTKVDQGIQGFPSQTDKSTDKKKRITNTPSKGNLIIDLSKLQNRSSSLHETFNSESQMHDRSRSEFDLYQYSLSQGLGQLPTFTKQTAAGTKDGPRKKKLRKINMEKFFELGQMLNKLADIDGQVSYYNASANSAMEIYLNNEMEKTDAEKFEIIKQHQQEMELNEDEEEDVANRTYRLPLYAKKSEMNLQNRFIVDLVNEKKVYRNFVQEVEIEAHKKMFEMRENNEVINRKPIKTNDQRFFQKIFGTMTLGCLRAVDKAYLDRTIAEKNQTKAQMIQKYKENKEFTTQQVNYYKEERLREIQKIRDRDKLQQTIAKRRFDLDRIQTREQVQETKSKLKDINVDRRKDVYLAVDFNKQHLSVSKALQKHEYNISREQQLKRNTSYVDKQRASTVEQQEIVRKYLEQRNILKISQTITDRQKIDSQVLQDANDRLLSAKKRVSRLKATTNASTKFYAIHNRSKASDQTISSVAIPSVLFMNNNPKSPNNEPLRVTVLDTTVMANVTPMKMNNTPLNTTNNDSQIKF